MVPVAPLGETVAVSVIDVPDVADAAEGVTVVLVVPVVLAEPVPLPPQPTTRKGQQHKAITMRMVRNIGGTWKLLVCIGPL
jgi:hypothetical protein